MSTLPDTLVCRICGGEGHLVCRVKYTVDCEDCANSTKEEHSTAQEAIEHWNAEQVTLP